MPSTYSPISDRKTYLPEDIQSSSQRNTIQLLAKNVDIAGVNTGKKHYYYVYTNNSGKQYYASAYPERSQPLNWGRIVHKTGEYKRGTPDYENSIRVGVISGSATEVNQTFQNMQSQFKKIDNSNISYGGTDNNSNSAAVTVLYSSGVQFGRNSVGKTPGSGFDVDAPGQETDLSQRLTSSSTTDKATTTVADNNSETRQHTATNSEKAAELAARANSNKPIGEPLNNNELAFAKKLANRAMSTEPIEKQLNKSNSDGLQKQKSTPSATGAVADNKKVQASQRGISR